MDGGHSLGDREPGRGSSERASRVAGWLTASRGEDVSRRSWSPFRLQALSCLLLCEDFPSLGGTPPKSSLS